MQASCGTPYYVHAPARTSGRSAQCIGTVRCSFKVSCPMQLLSWPCSAMPFTPPCRGACRHASIDPLTLRPKATTPVRNAACLDLCPGACRCQGGCLAICRTVTCYMWEGQGTYCGFAGAVLHRSCVIESAGPCKPAGLAVGHLHEAVGLSCCRTGAVCMHSGLPHACNLLSSTGKGHTQLTI